MKKKENRFLNCADIHKYDDILNLPHHVSNKHPQMPARDRAAQFAPFAALSGHPDAVQEAARLTWEKVELDDDCKAALDKKLRDIRKQIAKRAVVSVTYFVSDMKKAGGTYKTITGSVKKIEEHKKILFFEDGEKIPIEDIIEIEM